MAEEHDGGGQVSCMERFQSYLRTKKGRILAAEIVLCVIVFICYAASAYGGYTAVAICEAAFTSIFFVVYMMEFDKQFNVVHWPWSDLFRAVLGAVLFLITSLITIIRHGDGASIAGGVFGLCVGILYVYDSYLCVDAVKRSRHSRANAAPPNDA
ncbi:proteolipid protein 2 [Polypterus senegalus]|uniref:proteolipid protein 2 n=1 Tax=Polypterus senegalus TaxID=55291 RepID=UPI0019650D99|nr:proteolipid protein 2 [Polypterus senegalus]